MPSNGRASNIVIVGARGMGKSTLVQAMISNVKNYEVFDPNSEYKNGFYRGEDPMQEFKNLSVSVYNTLVVFEESTAFFGPTGHDKILLDALMRNRHRNNTNVFVFHSLRSIPLYIIDFVNFFILFHTKDTESAMNRKYYGHEEIIEGWKEMKDRSNPGEHIIIEI